MKVTNFNKNPYPINAAAMCQRVIPLSLPESSYVAFCFLLAYHVVFPQGRCFSIDYQFAVNRSRKILARENDSGCPGA